MIDAHQYAAYLATQGRADNTIRLYRAMYIRWVDYALAHGRDPWTPDALAVRAWASTIHGSRSVMAQARGMMLNLCAAVEVEDVSGAIPVPRQPRRSRVALGRERSMQLLATSQNYGIKGFAVRMAYYTAARRSEVAGMGWPGVELDAGTITFWRSKVRDWHTVALHEDLALELSERHAGERWLFPGRWGGHVCPATIGEWITEVGDAADLGVRVTPHVLRRTALTLINEANPDIMAAMEVAGHTDPRVTAGYTVVSDERARAAINSLPSVPRRDDEGPAAAMRAA